MLGQVGGEPVDLLLPALTHLAVFANGAVQIAAAPTLVPARLRSLHFEGPQRVVDGGEIPRRVLDLLEQQRPELAGAGVVQGEVLGAAVSEHPCDPARHVSVIEWLGGSVEERGRRADVEAGLVAVARERGVAPLAVELVGAEHERAIDRRALGQVRGERVPVVEVAGPRVALGQLDACVRRRASTVSASVDVAVDACRSRR